jgi:hypothetical protein
MKDKDWNVTARSGHIFTMNVCGSSTNHACAAVNGSICELDASGAVNATWGKWTSPLPTWTNEKNGVSQHFTNGDPCNNTKRELMVIYECSNLTETLSVEEFPPCGAHLILRTAHACKEGKKSLRVATIVLIIIVVAIFIFMALWCFRNW